MLRETWGEAEAIVDIVRTPLNELVRYYRRWATFLPDAELDAEAASPLGEHRGLGWGAAGLRMFGYVPRNLRPGSPLVVVLHGCQQTAVSLEAGCGWANLADQYGFALLMPEQRTANNPQRCFNWFQASEARRGVGECQAIARMAQQMASIHGLDDRRIFVAGLSAGGAMANALLASYPDIFAAGAIVAGLPYACADTPREALLAMRQGRDMTARELGGLVRRASSHAGPWPRISIWHGSADQTVHPANAEALARQWRDVHGLADDPSVSRLLADGHLCRVWFDRLGREAIESHTIPGMGHGFPVDRAPPQRSALLPDSHILNVGVGAPQHIVEFWGIEPVTGEAAGKDWMV